MKRMKFLALLPIVASLGIAFTITSKETKKADALIETKLCIHGGDEYVMEYNSTTHEYYVEDVDLYQNQEVIIVSGIDYYGFSHLDDDSYQLFYESEDNYIGIADDSAYCFYLYRVGEDFYIRASIDPSIEAENWALEFVQYVGCQDTYDSKPTNWDWYSESFANLSEGAKGLFVNAIASNEPTASIIEQAAFIHDMCVLKYGECSVFMTNESGSRDPQAAYFVNSTEFNTTALVIVIASVVSLTSLLALVIFKKSKARK